MSPTYAPHYPITRRHISKGTNIFVIAEKKAQFLPCLCRCFSLKISQNRYVYVVDDMGVKAAIGNGVMSTQVDQYVCV